MLPECLLAMTLFVLMLLPLYSLLSSNLMHAVLMRRRQEVLRNALSCLEASFTKGSSPSEAWMDENLTSSLESSYEIVSDVGSSDGGHYAEVSVKWKENGVERKMSLNGHFSR